MGATEATTAGDAEEELQTCSVIGRMWLIRKLDLNYDSAESFSTAHHQIVQGKNLDQLVRSDCNIVCSLSVVARLLVSHHHWTEIRWWPIYLFMLASWKHILCPLWITRVTGSSHGITVSG